MVSNLDENFSGHARSAPAQTPGMEVYQLPHLLYVDSGLSCDTFNIIHITNGRGLPPDELQTALSHFREKDFHYCIWLEQTNLLPELEATFHELGLSRQNEEVGMLLDLGAFQLIHRPEHAYIRSIDRIELLTEYAGVIARNWTPPDQNVLRYYERTANAYLDPSGSIQLLLYYHESEPVSTIELFPTNSKVIGLYGFATLEAYRGRGIGSSLFTYALNHAKAAGYQQALLQASEDGLGIYQKYGFKAITKYYEYA